MATSSSTLRAVLGPTNTGKTHYAVERMLAHRSGMIGLPLRLLAREVYNKIVDRVGAAEVALVTGEERIVPKSARYWVATVEAMPVHLTVEFVAIDEAQTATHFERGHIFTQRILHARGTYETLILGADTIRRLIVKLLPNVEIMTRPRLSKLTYLGSKKITRLPRRSAIVAFSTSEVYAIAELIRRQRGGAAVVMGALSPRTRNSQVELYQNGDVDFLVATDAIGMGLNLDVDHVAFAADMKFDGKQARPLNPAELAQIAGRAGRFTRDGTFGVTGTTSEFDDETIMAIENHEFAPEKTLQWRNSSLDFASIDTLHNSLNQPASRPGLTRAPKVADQLALEFIERRLLADYHDLSLLKEPEIVKLCWDCCQIPDYRGISPNQHGELILRILRYLVEESAISEDWINEQIAFADRTDGEIDTLSARIRHIRTLTFLANRKDWLTDSAHWRDKTKQIEDKLSDALHQKLTQRFVDRKTSVLMRHLRERHMLSPQINDDGTVMIEDQTIGTLQGFRFTLIKNESGVDAKTIRAAAEKSLASEITNRADKLAGAPNEEIILASDGYIRWRGEVIAELTKADDMLRPRIIVLADDSLSGADKDRVQERLDLWIRHAINTALPQILELKNATDLEGISRGVAFQLVESLGVVQRQIIASDIKNLDQDARAKLRKYGIRFGAYHIYMPMMLKPAPREIALMLWALQNGGARQEGVTELPQIIRSGRTSTQVDPAINPEMYQIAGFKVGGTRAVRVDILERLADQIRPLISFNLGVTPVGPSGTTPEGAQKGNSFSVTVEMTSLLGCAGDDFSAVLKSLGYQMQQITLPPEEPVQESAEDKDQAGAEKSAGQTEGSTEAAQAQTPDSPEPKSDEAKTEPVLTEPVETVPVEAVPTEAASTETAPAEAKPDSQSAETDAQSSEDEPGPNILEIWRMARTHSGQRHQRGQKSDKSSAQSHGKDNKSHRGKPRSGKPNPGKPHSGKPHRGKPPVREKPIDPDSPFAALAALKTKG